MPPSRCPYLLQENEYYGVCSRLLSAAVPYDLMAGVEAMSGLVAAIAEEQGGKFAPTRGRWVLGKGAWVRGGLPL